ncbi:MAG: cytochrome-c oxidase, cbb3-type subunit III [Pseudomonadota bacterium]|nr:MAG: cytochrome-c oxidase, cbb3-type subunit III [Pseudomonadota bacterium]
MSSFWTWYIGIITVGNILACYWLILWTGKPRPDEAAQGDVTGHTWDEDLQEYNNPLPRWWLWMFYITIVFGLGYLVLYPGLGGVAGQLGWTQASQYDEEMAAADQRYGPIFAAWAAKEIPTLARDADAMQAGQRLFLNYCATCHGSDAGGSRGFPNLTDSAWLYGGSPEAIKTSILDGRAGIMPPMGPALGEQGVAEVTAYVLTLNGREADAGLAASGKARFESMCAACHMQNGSGNPMLGAPNLTDDIWLYGGSPGVIKHTISQGRNGRMPAHGDFLGQDKVHLLAAYVYSLGQSPAGS